MCTFILISYQSINIYGYEHVYLQINLNKLPICESYIFFLKYTFWELFIFYSNKWDQLKACSPSKYNLWWYFLNNKHATGR